MDLGPKGKVVVITGGSSGIGLESARRFAEEGSTVIISARNQERLLNAAESIRIS